MKLELLMEDPANLEKDIMIFGVVVYQVNIFHHVERMFCMMKIGMKSVKKMTCFSCMYFQQKI